MLSNSNRWLTLTEAARQLGIHPTTLRRWADNGDIPVYITPGGHRRFIEDDITTFMGNRSLVSQSGGTPKMLESYALSATRQRLSGGVQPNSMEAFTEDQRMEQRNIGKRLLALIMQHISVPNDNEQLLVEARNIGRYYAQTCLQSGLTASDGLEIVFFFRDNLTEIALQMPELTQLDERDQLNLLRKINQVFNAVQLSLVEHFEEVSTE